ncbi:MAG: DNA mismatch repair protein MutS [Clostridiales bacterium]|nr:DNA mismatch repair protein MutS [Candidatus Equinaster intestinalis]
MAELSPMMRQYFEIKSQHEDSILFFRLGDFYEMFFEDAKIAAEELDLVLTGKDCGQEERAPMCGIPYHSCEGYIARLIEKGYKVAICEQMEDPAKAKGIVKRDVIKIITPGTVLDGNMLEEGKNNYLCAVARLNGAVGLCFTDASTGELKLTEIAGENVTKRTLDELGRFSPSEIISEKETASELLEDFAVNRLGAAISVRESESFDIRITEDMILKHFGVISVQKLGITEGSAAECALGATIEYLYETGRNEQLSVNKIEYYTENQFMLLDLMSLRNLEITETMRTKSKKGSLLWVLDKTRTAMGKRLMRSYAEKPLMDINAINSRQNAVEELFDNVQVRGDLSETLSDIRDIERIITKTVYGTANARDLRTLCETLKRLPEIKALLGKCSSRALTVINEEIDLLEDIKTLIDEAIEKDPPFLIREGGMIKDGYNAELDSLREIIKGGTGFITQIENDEKEKTGIKNLRIRYNKVFGYYIEVTNSFLDRVPENYIRKQTLTNCERFITEELKQIEAKVLGAHDRLTSLEYEIFCEIRKKTAEQVLRFQSTAAALSRLDVFCSFATVAADNGYVRPKLNNEGIITIKSGRHPVVERLTRTPFVSNDTFLNLTDERCAIITGPNMAGKSTYMRQVAIITIMAQMGSFVPAESANIGLVDAVFTRVGASDDLASGQSTFMLEMNEVANIIKNATRNSLIILDEIGRGTSTYDGMAIARAVLEYVAHKKTLGAKTLFATHYHELTQMENELDGVKNYNIAAKKRGDDIIFLRRIVRGGADESYGIEVAKLSGIPETVIKRAKVILAELLENGVTTYVGGEKKAESQIPIETVNAVSIYEELKAIDVNTLTPIEAMKVLFDLSDKAKSL